MTTRLIIIGAAVTTLTISVAVNATLTPHDRVRSQDDRAAQPIEASEITRLMSANPAAQRVEHLPTDLYRKVLGANDIVYKRFEDSTLSFDLYIARWRAGNRFAAEAVGHPPDLCWPAVGWKCEEARSGATFTAGTVELCPGEWRRFSAPHGIQQHVLFWCVVGKTALHLSYRDPAAIIPPISRDGLRGLVFGSGFLRYWWAGAHGQVTAPKAQLAEQQIIAPIDRDVYFVRVNSASSIEAVLASDLWCHLRPVLANVGLIEREGPSAKR